MKNFTISQNGYNKSEVNIFVNEVTEEYEKVLVKLKNKSKEVILLKEQLAHYKEVRDTLNKTMLVTQDLSEQVRTTAEEEAMKIIKQAKMDASNIVNDALKKAEKIEIEAEQLEKSLKIYKLRIKQIIEEQLSMINDVEPAIREEN